MRPGSCRVTVKEKVYKEGVVMKKIFVLAVVLFGVMILPGAEDLPAAVKNVAKDKIVDVTKYIYGKIRKEDKSSPTGKAVVYMPGANAKDYGGFGMGVFDPEAYKTVKKVVGFTRVKAADEKYHWYRIPALKELKGAIGKRGSIYLGNWSIGVNLNDMPGTYEYYVLVRAEGPFHVHGSKKPNALYLARAILVKK